MYTISPKHVGKKEQEKEKQKQPPSPYFKLNQSTKPIINIE